MLQGIPVVVVVVVVSVVVLPLSFQMMVDQNGLPSIATEEVFVTILRVVLPDLAHVENPYLHRHCHFVISLLLSFCFVSSKFDFMTVLPIELQCLYSIGTGTVPGTVQ